MSYPGNDNVAANVTNFAHQKSILAFLDRQVSDGRALKVRRFVHRDGSVIANNGLRYDMLSMLIISRMIVNAINWRCHTHSSKMACKE